MWNKGGTSQGTSGAMQWNRFSSQGGLMGGPNRTPKGPQMAQNCNFGAIRGCCGSGLAEQCGI